MLGGFNQVGFNQEMEYMVQLMAEISSESAIYTKKIVTEPQEFGQLLFNTEDAGETLILELPVIFSISSEIEGIAETKAIFSTRLQAEIEAVSEGYVRLIRVKNLESEIEAIAETEANIRKIKIEDITFTGGFKPGDTIIIDMDKFTVTLNGQNILHLVETDFFNLQRGSNTLVYTDTAESRTVQIQIDYRDRWV